MLTFSVQIEPNAYADDLFVGTYDDCANYCYTNDYYSDNVDARICEIEVDDNGIVIDTISSTPVNREEM